MYADAKDVRKWLIENQIRLHGELLAIDANGGYAPSNS